MKADKPNNNIFSISEIIKAKKKELTSNQNSLKETNSALTKTKDYSKEDNFHQSIYSAKFNKSKKINNKDSNTRIKRLFPERRLKYKTRSYLSNNKSTYSKNLNLQLKNIESILKYKDDANFNDSNYCESKLQDYAKLSNDKTNISSNSNFCKNNNNMDINFNLNKEKSKKTVSKIQHKFKRSSMSSKFLNLYLGDIKNMSKEDSNINLLTQINLNINSLLTTAKDEKRENEFENITILNISDSYLEDLDENSRIKIRKKNFFTEEKNNNFYDFNEESQFNRNLTSVNNITSKFNYVKNSNYLNFNLNADNMNSNMPQNGLPGKIKKNRKNFINNNNTSKNILMFENEFISWLSDENQTLPKRDDNTVMNLFNYLNFSDSEIMNKNSNNHLNFNFTSTESENVLNNSNNFNYLNENKNDKGKIKDNNLLKYADDSNYFQQSRNFCSKISGISTLKECLSGVSKFSTINNHKKKDIIKENNGYSNSEKSIITRKNSSIKKIIFRSTKENKLSNISILSARSNNSCSNKRLESDSDKENETIVNNKLKQTIVIENNNKSDVDMSNYAFDVDEFENQNEGNKLDVYNLVVKEQLIRQNTEEANEIKHDLLNHYHKNFSDEKKQNSQKGFFKKFFDKEQHDYNKHFPYNTKINKNSSVKNIFALKDIIQNKLQLEKNENTTKNSNIILLNTKIENRNKNEFFNTKDVCSKKVFYKNVSKKIKAVRLSSKPSYSELEQDLVFESDKIQKIQNFK